MTFRPPYFSKFETPPLPVTFSQSLQLDILGKDSRLTGKQRWPELPEVPVPSPINLTWIKRTVYLIGKDKLVTGKQNWVVPEGNLPKPKVQDHQLDINLSILG